VQQLLPGAAFHDVILNPHSLHGPPEAATVPGAMMNPHAGHWSR
jgi:hypothetical protein